jgi:hypothetical protein
MINKLIIESDSTIQQDFPLANAYQWQTRNVWHGENVKLKKCNANRAPSISIGKSKIEMGIAHKKASHAVNYLQANQRHTKERIKGHSRHEAN